MDYSVFKKVVEELNSTILTSFISGITLISSNDILLNFSHYRKEKLLISLNHASPFISLIIINESFSTIMNQTSETLRKECKEGKIQNIEILNNDRILKITITKTNDYFELETKYLILHFIPHRPNLILLNQDNKILFATHYSQIDATNLILKGAIYEAPVSNLVNEGMDISLDEYKSEVKEYMTLAKTQRRKDKFLKVVTFINSKIKSLKTKIKKIEKEVNKARENLIYKEYGEYVLTYVYDESMLNEYINEGCIKDYQNDLTLKENANRYYKLYKKAKSTIEHGEKEIALANEQIDYYSHLKVQVELGDDQDILEIQESLFPTKNKKNNGKVKAFSPHYILFNGVKIAFGKTDNQNDNLTFKRANPHHHFLHISDYSGAHVVIMSDNPTDEMILTASEICLILSKKSSGDIKHTKIKDVRKGNKLGEVHLKSYKNIYLTKVRKSTVELINNSSRFN